MGNCTTCATADKCLGEFLEKRDDITTAFDRMEQQKTKCKFGQTGVCCRLCSNGPCRITEKSPRGVCGATADAIVARNLLRTVAAGSACYLHVAESTARRLKSIGAGTSPIELRSTKSLNDLATLFDIKSSDPSEQAVQVADMVLTDLYRPRHEKMELVDKLAIGPRFKAWEKLNITPGGAKAEVFDALVKTSTNLNTDPVDQLLHCLTLGISTGLYGLVMTNLMNDVIMGEPEIRTAKTGFDVVDPDYVNIAVTGHSHSVFAGLIDYLETDAGQQLGIDKGAKGIRIIGLTCVGQDMQLRAASSGTQVFAGQAGNNFTQEPLLATGAIDLLVSEFNCTLSGIESIAEAQSVKMICLDDVSKQVSAELLADTHGKEKELARQIAGMAADQYAARRPTAKIDLPDHGRDDVLTGLSEKSLIKFLGGSLDPLINLLKDGTIKGVAGVLGCSNLSAGGHDVTTVALTRELIKRDILVLSAGCTSGGLSAVGLCSPSAAEEAGPGLRAVCEKLGIPPVLNFGPCLAIGRIELVVNALAQALDVDIPDLPVVISAPQWLEEQALADGCFGLALGLTLHLAEPPAILGSPIVTQVLTEGMTALTGGRVIVEPDAKKAAEILAGVIQEKLAKLAEPALA
jgi:anaerobic carbon-monoxide dehydrogenase catalytic subunit